VLYQLEAMQAIVSIKNLSKTYESGHQALSNINLDIAKGEIIALLGPNGAGKTTLISTICGIVTPSSGTITVDGQDTVSSYRHTRSVIGLVPQELTLGAFDTVTNTIAFSRGLHGKPANPEYIKKLLTDLSLLDKSDSTLMTLSGGMKRRVLIAKALAHEPTVLFLDEPTAGVDVELRKDMWALVRELRDSGVTIILTTHYIEEAESIADRVGVINNGELLLVEDKTTLMQKLGSKQLTVELREPLDEIPAALAAYNLELSPDGGSLLYHYDIRQKRTGITSLMKDINSAGLVLKDLHTRQRSLEDIFVNLLQAES
jgi:ABC-2 type transport system ATP-binding protein